MKKSDDQKRWRKTECKPGVVHLIPFVELESRVGKQKFAAGGVGTGMGGGRGE